MTITAHGAEGLRALVGRHLGHSEYVEVTQEVVDRFAEATGDRQWIHVDVRRAQREGPFGGPIAHGYLTLALGPVLAPQVLTVTGFAMAVNHGCERVRFPAPVPVGSKVRCGVEVLSVEEAAGGVEATLRFTFEVAGGDRPACVADTLFRYTT
jgi:acyl dehydratase